MAVTLIDPVAIAIVLGGSTAAAMLRSTRTDLLAATKALAVAVRADPAAEEARARAGVLRIERAVASRSRAAADRLDQEVPFVRRAAGALAEAADATAFARWAAEEAEALARRHARAQGVWRAIAEAAPAMGMIGTVIGLSRMFASLDDAAAIGPAMAIAMLTTLYGLVLSAAIAGPIAARLERLSAAEAEWRGWCCRQLTRLAEAEFAAPRGRAKLRLVE